MTFSWSASKKSSKKLCVRGAAWILAPKLQVDKRQQQQQHLQYCQGGTFLDERGALLQQAQPQADLQ